MSRRVARGFGYSRSLLAVTATVASAQTGSSGTSTGQSRQRPTIVLDEQPPEETRPATTTFFGDTGLWFVPTAEVLAHGKWSVSAYRRGTNYIQGYTNVGDFAGTLAVGIKDRAEIFGSFLVDTRIDRDVRPLFVPTNTTFGGFVDRYPRVNQGWTGDQRRRLLSRRRRSTCCRSSGRSRRRSRCAGSSSCRPATRRWATGRARPTSRSTVIASKDVGAGRGSGRVRRVRSGAAAPTASTLPGGAFRWGVGVGFPVAQSRCGSAWS